MVGSEWGGTGALEFLTGSRRILPNLHRRSGSRHRLGFFLNLRPSAAIDTQTHTPGHSD